MKLAKNITGKLGRKHILLLDADVSVRNALYSALGAENYAVVSAGDSREALSQFATHPIDLALLELNSSDSESNWCTVQRLAEMNPRLPIVLMTAQPGQPTHPSARHAQAWFQKPLLDLPLLLHKLSELTSSNKPSSEAGRVAF